MCSIMPGSASTEGGKRPGWACLGGRRWRYVGENGATGFLWWGDLCRWMTPKGKLHGYMTLEEAMISVENESGS